MKTHEYISKYDELQKSFKAKQDGLQKIPLDPVPSYYKYINELDDINEEFNGFAKEPHTVPDEAVDKIIIPYDVSMTVPNMKENNAALTDYCVAAHKALSVAKTLPTYEENLPDLKLRTDTAVEYQDKLKKFAQVEWDIPGISYPIVLEEPIVGGTVSIPSSAKANSVVTFSVTPNEGYVISEVKVAATDDSTEVIPSAPAAGNSYSFTMPEKGVTVKVTFEQTPDKVNIEIGDTGVATVTPNKRTAEIGEEVTLTVEVPEGSEIVSVTVNDVPLTATSTAVNQGIYKFTVTENTAVVKVETKTSSFTVSAPEQIEHGTVSFDKTTAQYGSTVNVTITPDNNYNLTGITVVATVNGKPKNITYTETDTGISFLMPAGNVVVTPTFTFSATLRTITATSEGNGTITTDKTEAYVNDIVSVTLAPSEFYELNNITVFPSTITLTPVGTNKFTFTMPDENVELTVSFKQFEGHSITITEIDPSIGAITANKTSAMQSEQVTVTATITDNGYEFNNFTIVDADGTAVEFTVDETNSLEATFTMPDSNVTITGNFAPKTITLPTITVDNATVVFKNAAGEPITQATYKELITYEIVCDEGYTIKDLAVNGEDKENAYKQDSYTGTFTMSTTEPTITLTPAQIQQIIVPIFEHGTATISPTKIIGGEEVTVTITSDEEYYPSAVTFDHEVTTDESGLSSGTVKITMPETISDVPPTITMTVTMAQKKYNITVANAHIIVKDGITQAAKDETVLFSVTPETDYEIDELTVAGTNSGNLTISTTEGMYSFVMPNEPVRLDVTFKKKQYTISKVTEGSDSEHLSESVGTIDITDNLTKAESGTSISFTVTPAETFRLQSVTINDGAITPVKTDEVYTFTMPQENVTLKAVFYHL